MTPAEFRAALECWQLDVDVLRTSRLSDEFWDVEVHYGSAHHKHTYDRFMLTKSTAGEIAMQVLGRCHGCGNFPVHPNVRSCGGSLCRYCEIRGGDSSLFHHTFDLDKLRQKLGPAELRLLIQTCTWEGPG